MPSKAPSATILNRMKYYEYQQGLIYRHMGQEGGWDSHLEKCRSFILSVIKVKKPGKITVLGSGWLLELPLAEIIDDGIKVNLVDIVHPPEVKNQTAKYKNVTLTDDDLSGGLASEVWRHIRAAPVLIKKRGFPEIDIPEYSFDGKDPGLVISLNLITQLEILPLKALEKRFKFEDKESFSFRRRVQEQHLNLLKNHSFILISDITEKSFFKNDREQTKETLLVQLPDATINDEWTWDFDMAGADYYMKKLLFTVRAIYCE
jgi:hypothetical protein